MVPLPPTENVLLLQAIVPAKEVVVVPDALASGGVIPVPRVFVSWVPLKFPYEVDELEEYMASSTEQGQLGAAVSNEDGGDAVTVGASQITAN